MKTYNCDKHGDRLISPELSVLRISGPLAEIVGRKELHIGKPASYDLAEWFGVTVARPEGLDETMDVRRKAEDERQKVLSQTADAGRLPSGTETR